MILRLIVFAVVIGAVYLGLRRIRNEWRERFRDLDKQTRERDLQERKRPDVIDLKAGEDGVFRPGSGGGEDRR